MEENFRRAMLISRGSFETFVTRPLSLSFLVVTAALLAWGLWDAYRTSRKARLALTAS
jgi:TctA family transporter